MKTNYLPLFATTSRLFWKWKLFSWFRQLTFGRDLRAARGSSPMGKVILKFCEVSISLFKHLWGHFFSFAASSLLECLLRRGRGQDWLHNLWGPAQNENAGHLVKKWWRISRWQEQSVEPRALLSMGLCMTARAWKLVLEKSFDLANDSALRAVYLCQ